MQTTLPLKLLIEKTSHAAEFCRLVSTLYPTYEYTTRGCSITSQRGSAWQCYIGHWHSIGKHAFFHLSAWKNQGNFATNFGIRNNVGKTYEHVKFGQDRFTRGASTQWWNITVLWLLFFLFFFFRFLISPTGRNSGPIRTFNSSNDGFGLVHVPFRGLEP